MRWKKTYVGYAIAALFAVCGLIFIYLYAQDQFVYQGELQQAYAAVYTAATAIASALVAYLCARFTGNLAKIKNAKRIFIIVSIAVFVAGAIFRFYQAVNAAPVRSDLYTMLATDFLETPTSVSTRSRLYILLFSYLTRATGTVITRILIAQTALFLIATLAFFFGARILFGRISAVISACAALFLPVFTGITDAVTDLVIFWLMTGCGLLIVAVFSHYVNAPEAEFPFLMKSVIAIFSGVFIGVLAGWDGGLIVFVVFALFALFLSDTTFSKALPLCALFLIAFYGGFIVCARNMTSWTTYHFMTFAWGLPTVQAEGTTLIFVFASLALLSVCAFFLSKKTERVTPAMAFAAYAMYLALRLTNTGVSFSAYLILSLALLCGVSFDQMLASAAEKPARKEASLLETRDKEAALPAKKKEEAKPADYYLDEEDEAVAVAPVREAPAQATAPVAMPAPTQTEPVATPTAAPVEPAPTPVAESAVTPATPAAKPVQAIEPAVAAAAPAAAAAATASALAATAVEKVAPTKPAEIVANEKGLYIPEGMVLPEGDADADADTTPRMQMPPVAPAPGSKFIGLRRKEEAEAPVAAVAAPTPAPASAPTPVVTPAMTPEPEPTLATPQEEQPKHFIGLRRREDIEAEQAAAAVATSAAVTQALEQAPVIAEIAPEETPAAAKEEQLQHFIGLRRREDIEAEQAAAALATSAAVTQAVDQEPVIAEISPEETPAAAKEEQPQHFIGLRRREDIEAEQAAAAPAVEPEPAPAQTEPVATPTAAPVEPVPAPAPKREEAPVMYESDGEEEEIVVPEDVDLPLGDENVEADATLRLKFDELPGTYTLGIQSKDAETPPVEVEKRPTVGARPAAPKAQASDDGSDFDLPLLEGDDFDF